MTSNDDNTDDLVDAVASTAFDSQESMRVAMAHPGVVTAARLRDTVGRSSTFGIHPGVAVQTLKLV